MLYVIDFNNDDILKLLHKKLDNKNNIIFSNILKSFLVYRDGDIDDKKTFDKMLEKLHLKRLYKHDDILVGNLETYLEITIFENRKFTGDIQDQNPKLDLDSFAEAVAELANQLYIDLFDCDDWFKWILDCLKECIECRKESEEDNDEN
jgi:hypothetical protein